MRGLLFISRSPFAQWCCGPHLDVELAMVCQFRVFSFASSLILLPPVLSACLHTLHAFGRISQPFIHCTPYSCYFQIVPLSLKGAGCGWSRMVAFSLHFPGKCRSSIWSQCLLYSLGLQDSYLGLNPLPFNYCIHFLLRPEQSTRGSKQHKRFILQLWRSEVQYESHWAKIQGPVILDV